MKTTVSELPLNARRFPASPLGIILLALLIISIYGGGISLAVWAGHTTVEAAHRGGEIPVLPWSFAFFFVILGMLSVIYGFFFRPREVRLADSIVGLTWWDGSCKAMTRSQVESVEVKFFQLVLRGGGETLMIPRIFSNWNRLTTELQSWAQK